MFEHPSGGMTLPFTYLPSPDFVNSILSLVGYAAQRHQSGMDFRWTGVAVYQPAAAMLTDPVAYCPPVDVENGDAGRPAFGLRVDTGLRHDRQHDSDVRFDGAAKVRELL